jgi:serine/threonine-protein kinase
MDLIETKHSVEVMPRMLGRYELLGALARGGMATVHLARHRGEAGFQRLFAIKVMHAHLADEEEFVSMLLDEARIAARLHHPNVVPIVDLGSQDGIHYVVMEYVEGCSLAALLAKFRDERPPRLLASILLDVLSGLHAAHTLTDEDDNPMNLVHRDVSPQNVMVGLDGTARLTDFGIARAASRIMSTRPGQMKGKIAFMSPEQIRAAVTIDGRADLFSAGAMAWSAFTGRRLFLGDSDAITLGNILSMKLTPPSEIGLKPPAVFDELILRALARDPDDRFASAQEMEEALRAAAEKGGCLGSRREVAAWVTAGFGDALADRRKAIKAAVSGDRITVDTGPGSPRSAAPSFGSLTPSHPSMQTPSGFGARSGEGTPSSSGRLSAPGSGRASLPGDQASADPSLPTLASPGFPSLTITMPEEGAEPPIFSEPPPARRRPLVIAGVVAALLAVAGVIALLVPRTVSTDASAAVAPTPVETAAPAAPSAAPPEPAPKAAEVPAAQDTPASANQQAANENGNGNGNGNGRAQEGSRPNPSRWAGSGAARPAKAEPAAKAPADVPPQPTAAPKEPPKKPTSWDRDSPLPPE